ncbi:MAG: hypothetical protein ACTS3F_07975 [Phycisphaerales bacterium]
MLKFLLLDDQSDPDDTRVPHAYLVGKEGRILPGAIERQGDLVRCSPVDGQATALAYQRRLPALEEGRPPSVLTLQTCLLPQSDRPYVLDLELARHRLMLYLTKLEEWGMSAIPADHPVVSSYERARSAFTRALAACGNAEAPRKSDAALAREAVALAVVAGEKLANLAAERAWRSRDQKPRRRRPSERARDLSAPVRTGGEIGCGVVPGACSEGLQNAAKQVADFLIVPMRWAAVEPEEGRFDLTKIDRWLEWAKTKASFPVMAGPVIDLGPRSAPDWLYVWEHDYESVREFAYEHAKRVITRYRKVVDRWVVASGINENQGFALSIDQMIELSRIGTMLARKLSPQAEVIIELNHPFGEVVATGARAVHPGLFAELVLEAGIDLDALLVRIQMGDAEFGRSTRDLLDFSSALDQFAQLEAPIDVVLGAPSGVIEPSPDEPRHDGVQGDQPAGSWRGGWTGESQSEWLTEATTIAMSKSAVRSVSWQSLCDLEGVPGEMALGGLIGADGKAKPGLVRLADAKKALAMNVAPTHYRDARNHAGKPGGASPSKTGGASPGHVSDQGSTPAGDQAAS